MAEIEMIERENHKSDPDMLETSQDTLLVSAYAELSNKETIVKFKKLFFIGFLVSFAGVYLGYTLGLPGNIVANQGESVLRGRSVCP